MSYNKITIKRSKIRHNNATQGEPIETKIERMLNGKEPITNGAPLLFTERKEGVRASTNIRTDRFLIAVEGADKIAKSYQARREARQNPKTEKTAETESTQGTQQAQK